MGHIYTNSMQISPGAPRLLPAISNRDEAAGACLPTRIKPGSRAKPKRNAAELRDVIAIGLV